MLADLFVLFGFFLGGGEFLRVGEVVNSDGKKHV